ncbi:MAG TPA: hypothetical protein VNL95_01645 [Dehalococcoidia bacterium]|nr:hypothetical protein [Dehalococcoidia bacterium]
MAEVFSGAVLGYGLSLVMVWPVSLGLVRLRGQVPALARAIAPNLGPAMLAVPVSLLLFAWGPLLGMIMGVIYRGALDNLPGAGLGSPNWAFTVGVVAAGGLVLATVFYVWSRLWWWLVLTVVLWVGAFGWGLPYLAEAAP